MNMLYCFLSQCGGAGKSQYECNIQVHTYGNDMLCYDSVCGGILTRILLFFQVLQTSKIEQ